MNDLYPRIPPLPAQATSFVGRAVELNEVCQRLLDPNCRLLTLVGPGGIGKSRLSLQAAGQVADQFSNGVQFVPLEPAHSPEQMLGAISDALGVMLAGTIPPQDQIVALLRDQSCLLLLDNIEQLLPEVDFLSMLLQECPQIKLLVTSREVLNLQEEWIYPLDGLALPADGNPTELEESDAVHLFAERARRVHAQFSLREECQSVGRICRLVEGMPLAIELAASWLRNMTCDAIAAEIAGNAGFLSTRLRNVPERHRSLQAVFEQTWRLLTPAEQATFRMLAVFENGFGWEAAQQIADASLAVLTGLVDKSLVRVDAQGRYHLHNLLRQFGRERLASEVDGEAEACRRHAVYYLGYVADRSADIGGADQKGAIRQIVAELDNVRAAWRWAVAHDSLAELRQAGAVLQTFFDFQSRFREEMETFEHTVKVLDQRPADDERNLTLAFMLPLLGWSAIRLGKLDQARQSFRRSVDLYRQLDAPVASSWGLDPLPGLGLVATILGDYTQAIAIAQEAEQLCLARKDRDNLQIVYYVWQSAAQAQGDYVSARRYAEQAYALTEAAGNRWMMAYILSELGNIARAQQEIAQARRYYTAGYEVKKSFDDAEGMAAALIQLAHTAQAEGAHGEATALFSESEAIYRRIHDQGGLASALHGLGQTALTEGDLSTAAQHLAQALHIAAEMHWTPLMLSILATIAELLRHAGAPLHSVELLALVAQHPAGDHGTRRQALAGLEETRAGVAADAFEAAVRRGEAEDLYTTATSLKVHLSTVQFTAPESRPPAETSPTAAQPLIEPLTARELEVLSLMAEGLTNQEIADNLIVAIGTVKSYTSQIYGKLGVRNRIEAVARADEIQLIS